MKLLANTIVLVGLSVLTAGLAPPPVAAQIGRLQAEQVIATSERAIGRTINNHALTDISGATFTLDTYRGKPLVISLVYSSCNSICLPTTQQLIAAVSEAGRVIGFDQFEVLTIGFDARNDTPARMAQFAAMQGVNLSNWHLASGDAETIEALLRDLGFSYAAVAGGFDHITQTTIIDRDGRIYRHVYGDDFPIQMFIEPLKDVVYGTSLSFSFSTILDRIRFICTTFDPGAGRYRIDYGLAFGSVIAGFSLLVFGGLLLREWNRTKHS